MATESVLCLPTADPCSSPAHSLPASSSATETPHIGVTPSNLNKKKKKKKSKKPKCKDGVPAAPGPQTILEYRQPVLCISRNKHWKYISSYHGPWLQLPLEILESLLSVNLDPSNFFPRNERFQLPPHTRRALLGYPPTSAVQPLPPPPLLNPSVPLPPPIDPGVFRSVASIRRLIDEASDLAVRAANGLSSTAINSLRSQNSTGPWGTAQSFGMNPLGEPPSRNVYMSSTRTHRLRVMAVQKLAAAYKADEVAASVMVMQGASALDELAERVLKVDPNDPDARYVNFFHEKIPSRQLADSTPTDVLDRLIKEHPSRLEYWRTRGIVRCFRDEYGLAIKDFTHALKEVRSLRKARAAHNAETEHRPKSGRPRKKSGDIKLNGQAPPSGTSVLGSYFLTEDPSPPPLHPSVSSDAPEPIEPQLLFLRAAAHLQNAVYLIEDAMLKIEGVSKIPAQDAVELKLTLMEHGRFGGVLVDNPHGPLGPRDSPRLEAYRAAMSNPGLREVITGSVRKSIRDHEKFVTYFDTADGSLPVFDGDLAKRVQSAFLLSESLRPGNQSQSHSPPLPENPGIFTTYHPLLVESYFNLLICHLILGDFAALLPAFQRAAALIDGLEGYPVFLPARSMAQAEFIEILERLATGWSIGRRPHSLSQKRLAIEAPPESALVPSSSPPRLFVVRTQPHQDSASTTRTTSPVECITTDEAKLKGKASDPTRPILTGEASSSTFRGSQSLVTEALPQKEEGKIKALQNLDYARMLLAPVAARRKQKEGHEASEKLTGSGPPDGKPKKGALSINIPLHGPRVDIVLAWLGAVHLPEMEDAAR